MEWRWSWELSWSLAIIEDVHLICRCIDCGQCTTETSASVTSIMPTPSRTAQMTTTRTSTTSKGKNCHALNWQRHDLKIEFNWNHIILMEWFSLSVGFRYYMFSFALVSSSASLSTHIDFVILRGSHTSKTRRSILGSDFMIK